MTERIVRGSRYGTIMALMGLTMGCLGDRGALPSVIPANEAVGTVTVTPHNAVLAVGGMLPLNMTATMLTGGPATQFDSVQYGLLTLADSVRLKVSHDGLLTGLAVTSTAARVGVVAFVRGTVAGDMVLVQVTPTALSGLTLSIQPPVGDSTKLASGTTKTITPVLWNPATGASIAGVQMQYEAKATDINRVETNVNSFSFCCVVSGGTMGAQRNRITNFLFNQIVPLVGEGSAWVYANINAYGASLSDSVLYTFSYPYTFTVASSKSNLAVMTTINGGVPPLSPGLTTSVTLAPGAIITFSSNVAATDPLTIAYTFDNPAAATAPATSPSITGGSTGNITALTGGQNSRRQFLTSGTYHWTTVAAGGPAPWPGQTFTGTIQIK